jgi:hypothetical protein
MTNHEKDRHVVAAAVHSQASIILTFNLRHFGPEHLAMWGTRALHPQSFLVELFRQEQALVLAKLQQQAADRGRALRQLLDILNATAPHFVAIRFSHNCKRIEPFLWIAPTLPAASTI